MTGIESLKDVIADQATILVFSPVESDMTTRRYPEPHLGQMIADVHMSEVCA